MSKKLEYTINFSFNEKLFDEIFYYSENILDKECIKRDELAHRLIEFVKLPGSTIELYLQQLKDWGFYKETDKGYTIPN